MKKQAKKPLVLASALVFGMTAFVPLQASAANEAKEPIYSVQIEQQLKGKIIYDFGHELLIKTEDGKKYHIGLYAFTDEQIEQMNLSEGADIFIEGQVLESTDEFNSFDVYKRFLPEGISKEDLAKLEKLHKEMRELEKTLFADESEDNEAQWDALSALYDEMYEIEKPYRLAEWEPETFEEYMAFFKEDLKREVAAEDLEKLEALYTDYVKFAKDGNDKQAEEKIDAFFTILNDYLDMDEYTEPETLEDYLKEMELEISEADKTKLKPLYEEMVAARKDAVAFEKDAKEADEALVEEKWESVWAKMDQIWDVLDPYMKEAMVSKPFADYIANIADDELSEISKDDLAALEAIYEELKELAKNKDYDAMDEKWDDFYKILDPYFNVEEIPFKASKVVINGHSISGTYEYKAANSDK